jgi:uncharacterized Tic20 family protein
MRKAAGILMVIFGLTVMCRYVDVLGKNDVYFELHFTLFVIISAVFVITGGLFCLKRKYWVLCFISSLFFNYFVLLICSFGIFPYVDVVNWFLIPVGIVPLIFTCLRKREWQEILA